SESVRTRQAPMLQEVLPAEQHPRLRLVAMPAVAVRNGKDEQRRRGCANENKHHYNEHEDRKTLESYRDRWCFLRSLLQVTVTLMVLDLAAFGHNGDVSHPEQLFPPAAVLGIPIDRLFESFLEGATRLNPKDGCALL